jgi:hypothetical protein
MSRCVACPGVFNLVWDHLKKYLEESRGTEGTEGPSSSSSLVHVIYHHEVTKHERAMGGSHHFRNRLETSEYDHFPLCLDNTTTAKVTQRGMHFNMTAPN